MSGAAQDHLGHAKRLSLKLPIPGIIEQKYSADTLPTYEDLIENNRRRAKERLEKRTCNTGTRIFAEMPASTDQANPVK